MKKINIVCLGVNRLSQIRHLNNRFNLNDKKTIIFFNFVSIGLFFIKGNNNANVKIFLCLHYQNKSFFLTL